MAQPITREWWPDGHRVMTLGPHTGHTVRAVAFCDTAETARVLGNAYAMLDALKAAEEYMAARTTDHSEPYPLAAVRLAIKKAEG